MKFTSPKTLGQLCKQKSLRVEGKGLNTASIQTLHLISSIKFSNEIKSHFSVGKKYQGERKHHSVLGGKSLQSLLDFLEQGTYELSSTCSGLKQEWWLLSILSHNTRKSHSICHYHPNEKNKCLYMEHKQRTWSPCLHLYIIRHNPTAEMTGRPRQHCKLESLWHTDSEPFCAFHGGLSSRIRS